MQDQPDLDSLLETQLLFQLGDRLRRARKARRLSSVALAEKLGISRVTLAAVEAGSPSTAMGTYIRVLAALGMVGDLALLAAAVQR